MTFDEVLSRVLDLLQRQGRVSYRALKRRFDLDDDYIEDLKAEIIKAQRLAVDEGDAVLVWTGGEGTPLPARDQERAPLTYTPAHLSEKILTSRTALEGERKQVTVLFADIKGSTELIAGLDPEEARTLLDPALRLMMHAVHRYEGTVNQVLGDGIMALFGAPLAHEDHAVRSCYAALAMQEAMRRYSEEARHTHGVEVQLRVGLNSGAVVVRAIGDDLHMDYAAVGQTTHLAARMEQLAPPGSIRLTTDTLRLAEGFVEVTALGLVPVKGLTEPVAVWELVGVTALRRRLQAAVARGLSPFVGRQPEVEALQQALARAAAGQGQVVALLGEPGVGKSRLVYEFLQAHHTQGWLRLESSSVSYGKATAYLPVCDLLKAYCHIEDRDDLRTVRAKITGHILTLDEALQDTVPAVLALFEALPADSPFLSLDPLRRRRRTLEALKRVLLRESRVQPLLLVFEDLHWIDTETQAVLDLLVESLPTARVLLLVNYRPEYQHGWGSKTYYTQLRLDVLPPARAEELLQALLGNDPGLAPLSQLLIARTQGNPFFLEESVRTLVETGVLVGDRGAYHLAKSLDTLQVPATVQALLAARLDRLPPEDKRLLQTAAVIGTEVPWPLLQAIADTPDEALYRSLAHLQAAEFLYETSLFPEPAYTFKHALTHEVAYGSLLHERRRGLHARIVAAVSRGSLSSCHAELGAFTEGLALAEEGLQIAETVNSPFSLIQVCYGVSVVYRRQGDVHRAIPMLERAMGLCQDWHIPVLLPGMATALGLAYVLDGRVAAGLALAEYGVEQAVTSGRLENLARSIAQLSEAYLLAGRLENARQHAAQALELARQYQQRGNQAWALRLLGEVAARQASPEAEPAAGHYRQALALAEELGMRPLQAHCHHGLGTLYLTMAQHEQARAALSIAIALYRAMDMRFWLPQAEAALAQVRF